METFLIIVLLVIIVLLFKISKQLKRINNDTYHLGLDIKHLNEISITTGNHIVDIVDTVQEINHEIQNSEESIKRKEEEEKFFKN